MKAVVAAFNQEKALVAAFSVITNLRMEIFEALSGTGHYTRALPDWIWRYYLLTSVPQLWQRIYIDNYNVWKRRILLFRNLKCLVLLNLRTIELKNISLVKEDTYFELGKLNKQTNIQN